MKLAVVVVAVALALAVAVATFAAARDTIRPPDPVGVICTTANPTTTTLLPRQPGGYVPTPAGGC